MAVHQRLEKKEKDIYSVILLQKKFVIAPKHDSDITLIVCVMFYNLQRDNITEMLHDNYVLIRLYIVN